MPVVCDLDRLYADTLDYLWWAERYHYTPDQVDALPWWYATHAPTAAAVLDEIRNEDAERQAKAAQR